VARTGRSEHDMHKHVVCAFAAALAAGGVQAETLPTQWGVSASTVWADCSLLACDQLSFAFLGNPILPASAAGGLNQSAAAQLDVAQVHDTLLAGTVDMGLASAEVAFDPAALAVPILRARASATSHNGWVGGLAIGIQGYEYTGVAPDTVNLDAFLSGTVVNPIASDVTGLSVGLWLIRDDPALAFPGITPTTIGELLLVVAGLLPVEDAWTVDALASGPVALGTQDSGGTLSIALAPGDRFYLLAALSASATGIGASADSFSTLTLAFDTTALLPAGVAIPVPPAAWLFASACAGLALVRRFNPARADASDRSPPRWHAR
jgi:hypothetical protein